MVSCKKVFIFVLLCTIATTAFSQITIGSEFFFNLNCGSTFENNQLLEQYSNARKLGTTIEYPVCAEVGGNISFRYNFSFLKSLGFQTEITFFHENSIDVNVKTESTEFKIKYSYDSIEVPALITFDFLFPKIKAFSISLLTGVNFSFPISKLNYQFISESSGNNSLEFDLGNKCIFGITGGIDFNYIVHPFIFFIGIRYLNDFSPVYYKSNDSENNIFVRREFMSSLGFKLLI